MKVRFGKGVANHSGPESGSDVCAGEAETLAEKTGRPGFEPRDRNFGMQTLLSEANGNTVQGVSRRYCNVLARSQSLRMPGSFRCKSWEVSSMLFPSGAGRAGKTIIP